ncbi:MAG: apolipoprotein N-acyltransferase [Pseudomonadota bacterium]|nr:apolipoprotein N-acyltransferase [Pseudomonadota bacterium]
MQPLLQTLLTRHLKYIFKHTKYILNYPTSLLYPFIIGMSLYLAFPPHAQSYAIFVSITIFLIGLEHTQRSFCYGYIFYLGAAIAFIGYWFSYYFRLQLNVGYFISYLLTSLVCFYTALYIGIICWLYFRLKSRYTLFNLLILFPSLWVLTELIRGFFFPRSWYALGNIFVNNFFFHGYYPLFGAYFVSWLIMAISGALTYCYLNYTLRVWLKLVIGLSIFVGISYTLSSIKYTKPYGKPLKIAMVQPSIFSSTKFDISHKITLEVLSLQLLSSISADLIILPETVFGVDYHYLTDGYLNQLNNIANQKHAAIIFGSPIIWDDNPHQTGIIDINNLDTPVYLKHYLVPFGEYNPLQNTFFESITNLIGFKLANYVPGAYAQPPMEILGQKLAFNICYENTINDYVADGAKNATILVNQSDLSWYGKTHMKDVSLQFSQARALENQRYFIQDGNSGDTVVINPYGQIEKKIPAFTSSTLVYDVPGYTGVTPFEKWQNTPIWLLCCFSVMIALVLRYSKLKK